MTKQEALSILEKMTKWLLEIEEPMHKNQVQAMSRSVIFLLQEHVPHAPQTKGALEEARLHLASFAPVASSFEIGTLRRRQKVASVVSEALDWIRRDDKWREEHQ